MGTFIEIAEIAAPGQAGAGEPVTLIARIKNLAGYILYAAVTGEIEGVPIAFIPPYASIGSGDTYSFTGSFTMPARKSRIKVIGWCYNGSQWLLDDQRYIDIDISGVRAQGFEQFEITDYLKV